MDALTPHIDDVHVWDGTICTLSMQCDSVMHFKKAMLSVQDQKQQQRLGRYYSPHTVAVPVPRRSLLILQGKWRYDYTHAMSAADLSGHVRISLTVRRKTGWVRGDSDPPEFARHLIRRTMM